jgi:hypothetical protein
VPDDLCAGRGPDPVENEGGAGAPAPLIILISLMNPRLKKSFALPGQAVFEAPETSFRNVATPPFEGAPFVFANRPDPVVRRPAPPPPEKRSDARRRLSNMTS